MGNILLVSLILSYTLRLYIPVLPAVSWPLSARLWLSRYKAVDQRGAVGERGMQRQKEFDGLREWEIRIFLMKNWRREEKHIGEKGRRHWCDKRRFAKLGVGTSVRERWISGTAVSCGSSSPPRSL
ncbi:hypothetical protein BXZ70DRAFT_469633 [Cristinia sonorae]|uniref:Uncharacterized protein n=1 Tax=Cristinia sonorae TaxID=1940300 RepID=A0A8K0UIE9_9AGAR|nr:hypothetical protein BXZ70DRAFT_469633 [Cristinia sonorae]